MAGRLFLLKGCILHACLSRIWAPLKHEEAPVLCGSAASMQKLGRLFHVCLQSFLRKSWLRRARFAIMSAVPSEVIILLPLIRLSLSRSYLTACLVNERSVELLAVYIRLLLGPCKFCSSHTPSTTGTPKRQLSTLWLSFLWNENAVLKWLAGLLLCFQEKILPTYICLNLCFFSKPPGEFLMAYLRSCFS